MYVFMDTETGGLTPDHSLLTISAIAVDKDFNILPLLGFNPGVYLEIKHTEYVTQPKAMEINQIDLSQHSKRGFSLEEATAILRAYFSEAKLAFGGGKLIPAGHNFAFDLRFIHSQLFPPEEWGEHFTHPPLDTCAAARFMITSKLFTGGCGLVSLCKKFGIQLSDAHNAEADNLATIELAKKLRQLIQKPQATPQCNASA